MTITAPKEIAYCSRCSASMTTKTKAGKLRRVCIECGFTYFAEPKVGVGVAVIDEDKLMLVQRRMNPERGKWSLPGGYLDRGEDPQQTAVREALEETNLEVEIDGLVGVYHNPPSEGGASVFILYQAKRVGGTLQAGDDADDAGFFGLDELPEIAFSSTLDAIEKLKERLTNK